MEMSGQLYALLALPLGKEREIGGWLGPRVGLDMAAKRVAVLAVNRTSDVQAVA
jgi:hypothetical protein